MELAEKITNEPGQDDILAYWDNHLEVQKHYLDGKNGRLNHVVGVLKSIVKPGMSIFDIGCGIGMTSKAMGEMGAKVWALDISRKLIRTAKVHNAHKNVLYEATDIMTFDFPGKADLVVAVDVIEHLDYELGDICRELSGYVKSDGMIFINIPDYRFAEWAIEFIPKSRQIIDKAIFLNNLMDRMSIDYNFQPVYLNIYGIDVTCQYNDIIFQHRDVVEKGYKRLLK